MFLNSQPSAYRAAALPVELYGHLACREGFEPPTYGIEARSSDPLSYRQVKLEHRASMLEIRFVDYTGNDILPPVPNLFFGTSAVQLGQEVSACLYRSHGRA